MDGMLDSDSVLDFDGFMTVDLGINEHFAAALGSGSDVVNLIEMSDVNVQWFERHWQRFCCRCPWEQRFFDIDRLIYVNVCFHLYFPSH